MRRFATLVALSAGMLLSVPAGAVAPRRVLIVLVSSDIGAWSQDRALARVIDDGAIGSVEDVPRGEDRAIAVLGSGEASGADPSALARAISLEGVPFVARAEAGRALGAGNIRVDPSDAVPGDLATPSLAVLDGAPLVPVARALMRTDDVLIVLHLPPAGGAGAVAIVGEGFAGLVRGHAAGGARLADIAPTVLGLLEVEVPDSMRGRPLSSVAADDPLAAIASRRGGRSALPSLLVAVLAGALLAGATLRRRRLRLTRAEAIEDAGG